jgi:phosphohistidine phosphatase SixA
MKHSVSLFFGILFSALFYHSFSLAHTNPQESEGRALIERMQQGGLVIFMRHADTFGMPCDRLYRLGQREGQRNISEDGKAQSRQLGKAFAELSIPIQYPVLAGPVFRARDTAELAFGVDKVEITDSLLADDYADSRGVRWIITEHQRLFSEIPESGLNRILVGHRTPALMALEGKVRLADFPEGAAIIMQPTGDGLRVLGVISLIPQPNPGVSRC